MASCYLLYLLVPAMFDAASSRADADKTDNKIPAAAAAATIHELSDLVLDFGFDSMPACSTFLRAASPVFNRRVACRRQSRNDQSWKWPGGRNLQFSTA